MRSGYQKIKDAVLEALQEFNEQPRPFNCNHCPRNADPQRGAYCPAWGSILLTTVSPGGGEKTEVVEECYFNRMEKWHEGIRSAVGINIDSINEVRAEIHEAREHTSSYLDQIATLAVNLPALQNLSRDEDQKVLSHEERRPKENGAKNHCGDSPTDS